MRNLKRVLSLALASVMLLGMMVIGAGAADKTAADLTDMDKVTNKEAVSVMVDLGIIEGKPDGSFAPTEGVDRATMAKLITYVLMGDVDAAIFEGTSTDLTDIDTNWAEGYIKYCYANGIISGDGQGHFFPTQGVTVVQAAKMLLVALGYDAEASKYQNNAMWSVNIMKDAQVAGLLNGVEGTANDTLTRDGAAQMIFNTLNAKTVTPKFQYDMGVQYLSEYVVSSTTLGYQTYGMVKVTATVTGITADGKASLSNVKPEAAATLVNEKLPVTPDMVGNAVNLYVKGTLNSDGTLNKAEKLISTSLVIGATNVLGTSTDGTSLDDLTTKLSTNKKFIAELDEKVYYFVNGESETEDDVKTAIKAGVIVELIDTDNTGKADLVKLTVKEVKTVVGEVKTKTENDVLMVAIPGVTSDSAKLTYVKASELSGYEGLAKDDVVLTVKVGNMTYIEKAASVEGVVTGIKGDTSKTYKVDGVYYAVSALAGASNSGYTDNDFKNTYTFYLDNGNNIVKAVKVTEEVVTKTAVVLDYGKISGSGIGGTNVFQAQLLFEDGTVEIVEMNKFGGKTIVASSAGKDEVNYGDIDNGSNEGKFVEYSVDKNGKYELTLVDSAEAVATDKGITSNTAKFDGTNVANANTIFLVKKGTGSNVTYTAYKGIANVPSVAQADLKGGQVVSKDGVATYVYIVADKFTGDVSAEKYTYIISAKPETVSDGNNGVDYVYSAIVDGEKTTLTADTELFKASGLYTYQTTDGVVTKAESKQDDLKKGITTISGGTLVVGADKTAYLYTDDTVFYAIDEKAGTVESVSSSNISADKDVEVFVIKADKTENNTASVVFVITPAEAG